MRKIKGGVIVSNRGVKKVNENITQKGRSLIVTSDEVTSEEWGRLEDGTIKVDSQTGDMFVKLKGESDWVPLPFGAESIVNIVRDNIILYEVFTVTNKNNGDGTFTYSTEDGAIRVAPLSNEGWHVFELEKGSYILDRNKIEATIDDTLSRSTASGGLIEIDNTRFAIPPSESGTEITACYIQKINVDSLQPRILVSEIPPFNANFGDVWIKPDLLPSSKGGGTTV